MHFSTWPELCVYFVVGCLTVGGIFTKNGIELAQPYKSQSIIPLSLARTMRAFDDFICILAHFSKALFHNDVHRTA